jgi:hypothetical protein
MKLRAGDSVRVRSCKEILTTLDEHGRCEGVPFMPQMVALCGRRFRVSKRAHKFCHYNPEPRRMQSAVFLDDIRCDGQTYGGCEMDCLIIWKEAWLERARDDSAQRDEPGTDLASLQALKALAMRGTRQNGASSATGEARYACQATELAASTTPQSVWDMRQYVEDVTSGNVRPGEVLSVLSFLLFETVATAGIGLGWMLRRGYDIVQKMRGGSPYPYRKGHLPRNSRTPSVDLGIQPGELVKIKTYDEVLASVTEDGVNRGMNFAPEMVPHCGKTFRVSKRLGRLMNERTGELMELKNQCLVLEGASCAGHFTRPFLCPRGMSPYWREVWLERAGDTSQATGRSES